MKTSDLKFDTVLSRKPGWLSGRVGDELVMMNADSSEYINLSETGGRISELLEKPCALGELCELVAEEYDVTAEQAAADMAHFIEDMRSHHVLHIE